jgi:hypothetical protein
MKKFIVMLCLVALALPVSSICANRSDSTVQTTSLPSHFSWRDINGTDYTTPIRDQAPAPTCEAFAICAALETEMQYKLKERYLPDLSENHLFFYAGGTMAKGYVSLTDAANYLMVYGVPDEGCYPDPHRPSDYPFQSLPGWENRTVKISEWGWIPHNVTTMKQALINHGPLVICIHYWRDFYWYRGGIYKNHTGKPIGGHVVAIVGYNDSENCWIVKNSDGTQWGEDGWFRMAYDADMISDWYGPGTGVMYLDGVYGNLKPDVPKVHLQTPVYFHTYLFGKGFPTIMKKLPLQRAAVRIVGPLTVTVAAENTSRVEFFVDNESQYIDTQAPFSWELQAARGLHTLEVKATDDHQNSSIDIVDFYVLLLGAR